MTKKYIFLLLLLVWGINFASIKVLNYSIYPSNLSPSSNGVVSLVVYNSENFLREDIRIIPLTSKGINAWESIIISELSAFSSTQVNLPFKIREDAEAGIYSLNLEIRYGSRSERFSIPIVVYDEPKIYIELLSINEKVITKGSEINLKLRIHNFGGNAKSIFLTLNSSIFSIKDKSMVFINEIQKNSSIDLNLTLISHSDINSPQNLIFIMSYSDSLGINYVKTNILVITVPKFTFELTNIKITPDDFVPGDEVRIDLSVINKGADVNNLFVCLSSDWTKEICKLIGYLPGGATSSVSFVFLVPENAKSTIAKIKLKEGEKEFYYSLPLEIYKKIAKLVISNIKSDLQEGSGGTLEIKIENNGNGDAKSVQVILYINNEKYTSIVGKIPKDDRSTASFYIPLIKDSGVIDALVEISYLDSEGPHKTSEKIQIYVNPKRRFEISPILIILIIVTVVLAYLFLRKKK